MYRRGLVTTQDLGTHYISINASEGTKIKILILQIMTVIRGMKISHGLKIHKQQYILWNSNNYFHAPGLYIINVFLLVHSFIASELRDLLLNYLNSPPSKNMGSVSKDLEADEINTRSSLFYQGNLVSYLDSVIVLKPF